MNIKIFCRQLGWDVFGIFTASLVWKRFSSVMIIMSTNAQRYVIKFTADESM